jgi:hypothetical protein
MEYTKINKKIFTDVYEECVDVELGKKWEKLVDTDYKEFGREYYWIDKDVWLKVIFGARIMRR